MPSALIVGTGLLGTSIGLSLRAAGWNVWLSDRDQRAVHLAASLGAGDESPAFSGSDGGRGGHPVEVRRGKR